MHKGLILTLTFMGSVYGMDQGPGPQEQRQGQANFEALHQDQSSLFSQTPSDLFPIIERYKIDSRKMAALQHKINTAKSIHQIIEIGKTYRECKTAPIHLDLTNRTFDWSNDSILKKLFDLFPSATTISLSYTTTTDAGLKYLKDLPNLTTLNLQGTHITDPGVVHLKDLPNLKILNVRDTKITQAGIRDLQEALPNCKIIS